MFFTSALQVVFNLKGGRKWNKPWGLIRLTPTRKENRRKIVALFNKNISVLKAAAAAEPEVPVRLFKPLPFWQRQLMKKKLDTAQQALNWRCEQHGEQLGNGAMLPAAARVALGQPQPQRQRQS